MNLVEIYLKEILSVEIVYPDEYPQLILAKVNAIWDCHGNVHQKERLFLMKEWEQIKQQGYFLG